MLTLRQVKSHLRLDSDEEDESLAELMATARTAIENYLKRSISEIEEQRLSPIRHAALLLIGHWYANREATSDRPLTEIPFAVKHLLSPYRRLV